MQQRYKEIERNNFEMIENKVSNQKSLLGKRSEIISNRDFGKIDLKSPGVGNNRGSGTLNSVNLCMTEIK